MFSQVKTVWELWLMRYLSKVFASEDRVLYLIQVFNSEDMALKDIFKIGWKFIHQQVKV